MAAKGLNLEPDTYREALLLAYQRYENAVEFLKIRAITSAILATIPQKGTNQAFENYKDAMQQLMNMLLPESKEDKEISLGELLAVLREFGKEYRIKKD